MSRQNGISVEDMLKLDIMKNCTLIAGFRGIRNTISRVNIMADPDILEWIAEGEFLLTTAYFFESKDIEMQKEMLKVCVDNKLAGIGIKIAPYLEGLNQEVLEYANKLNFPVIDIHENIPLSDIMMIAIREIFNKQASLLERIERVHEKLMGVMLEGKGFIEVLNIIQENIKNPVVLSLSFSNEILSEFGDASEVTKKELLNEVRIFYEANGSKDRLKRLNEDKVLVDGKYVDRMVMPILLKDQVHGHIFAWSTHMPLGGFDLAIIESASTTIALSILQDLSVQEVELRYRSDFFDDLVSPDAKRKKKALDRARYFNLKEDAYFLIEVMSIKAKGQEFTDLDLEFENYGDYVNTFVKSIEDLIAYYKLEGIVSTKVNGIQILLAFPDMKNINKKIKNFNESLKDTFLDRYKHLDLKVGVGRVYKHLDNVHKSFLDAVRTVRIGKTITCKEIVTYDELGIFKILCQDYLNDELEDFYNSTLKGLVDYDNKKSTDLIRTLESYFQNNGNLTKISKDLFTHYNTVLYRIGRINEITGMNLDDPHNRLNLEIALKIKEILGK
ncbi:PucR family transcriptional regulator [Tissierella creatinini]|nr:PucR family transcriptional regulator [Tissierella creatinini]TJX63924.1 PucR family transcriptional regulator [Soehngenia saccharolytica]